MEHHKSTLIEPKQGGGLLVTPERKQKTNQGESNPPVIPKIFPSNLPKPGLITQPGFF